jgi:hypothetical protein
MTEMNTLNRPQLKVRRFIKDVPCLTRCGKIKSLNLTR